MAGAGALFGYFAARGADAFGILPSFDDLTGGQLAVGALLILPMWFLAVLAHELGHLTGGALAGSRPLLLMVGPMKVTWVAGRPQLGLNRSLNLAGGVAAAAPDDDRDLVRRQLLMVAGGPLTSLLLGALLFLAMTATTGLTNFVLLLAALLSLAIGVITLLPMQASGFYSDGARILLLLRGGPQAERLGAAALIVGAMMAGRIAQVDPSIVARATALGDGSLDDIGAALLAYTWALARGEVAEAGRHIDHALAHEATYVSPARPALLNEGAYYLARHRGAAAQARAYFEQARGAAIVEPHDRLRAEAAVLLAEGRPDEARAAAEAGLAALGRARMGPAGELDRAMLHDLREACTMPAATA